MDFQQGKVMHMSRCAMLAAEDDSAEVLRATGSATEQIPK